MYANKKTFFLKILLVACCVYFGVLIFEGNRSEQQQQQQDSQDVASARAADRNIESIDDSRNPQDNEISLQQEDQDKAQNIPPADNGNLQKENQEQMLDLVKNQPLIVPPASPERREEPKLSQQPNLEPLVPDSKEATYPIVKDKDKDKKDVISNDVDEVQKQQQQPSEPEDGVDVLEAEERRAKEEERRYNRVLEGVKKVTGCTDRAVVAKTQQRGDYWVLYNYVRAERSHRCHETVTYTTHADYSFLDNLVPLLERWKGPISVALHAPGSDFKNTLEAIAYLRDCTDPMVRELVTFHVYFSTKHVPKEVPKHGHVFNGYHNCSLPSPFSNVSSEQMYKAQKNLLYPVNVGRNIARETAQTHYILPSDIELYPSADVISQFLTMIAANKGPLLAKNPKVFPLHIFEVSRTSRVPENKTALLEMLKNGTAIPFHKKVCPECHAVPKSKEWQLKKETRDGRVDVFHVGKRNGKFVHWEPIFIGTHADPLYDERLSWEGKSDKMTQGYALCVMDYNFLILDDAFLVHKPGIKVYKKDAKRDMLAGKTRRLIKKIIFPELKILYGTRKGCAV